MTNSEIKNFSQNVSSSYHLEDRNKNIPKLRFKEYNDEWKKVKLKDIATRITRKNKKLESDRPLTISAINGLIDQKDYFNRQIASKDMSGYYLLKNGEFAYNKSYSNGYPYGSIKRLNKYDKGALSTLYICFSLQNICSDFLEKYFETDKWYKEIYMIAVEGARNHGLLNISVEDFFNTIHKFPSLAEQEKIASFLTLIDKKIEKQKELIELLKKYKRGLLSSIFSQKLRFKDNNGNYYPEWEEKRLEEILKIKHGKSQKEIECANGNYPILATGGEIGRTNSCLWDKPCVLIGRKGTIDKPQYMETPFWTVDTLFYSEVFKENNAKYLYYLFNTINWNKYDESTGVPSLSAKTIERIKATVSIRYTEQVTISKILSKLDNKTQQEECMLSNIQTYKKGLLQQMFT